MDTIDKLIGVKPPRIAKSTFPVSQCSYPTLVMGMELEIENIGGFDTAVDRRGTNWTVTDDGSLRPIGSSWEFVSKPLFMENMVSELKEFFVRWHELTVPNNYSDRTSVHIHTNVTNFTQEQLLTLALTYTVVEDILFTFINTYAPPNGVNPSRDTNIYCIPWTQCRMNSEFAKMLLANPTAALHGWQKYTALNLLPVVEQGSVEWRHMHGTNDIDKLTKWLNIIGCIMKFSKTTAHADVVNSLYTLNDTSAYRQFFDRIFQGYLEYSDTYTKPMSDGVINAKLTLINKNVVQEKTTVGINWAGVAVAEELAELELLDDGPENNALNEENLRQAVNEIRAARLMPNVPEPIGLPNNFFPNPVPPGEEPFFRGRDEIRPQRFPHAAPVGDPLIRRNERVRRVVR